MRYLTPMHVVRAEVEREIPWAEMGDLQSIQFVALHHWDDEEREMWASIFYGECAVCDLLGLAPARGTGGESD